MDLERLGTSCSRIVAVSSLVLQVCWRSFSHSSAKAHDGVNGDREDENGDNRHSQLHEHDRRMAATKLA